MSGIDYNRLTPEMNETLNRMDRIKGFMKHEWYSPEHLLFSLLADPVAQATLMEAGVEIDVLEQRLEDLLGSKHKALTMPLADADEANDGIGNTSIKNIIMRPFLEYGSFGDDISTFDGADFLYAFFDEDCDATRVLEQFTDRDEIRYAIDRIEVDGARWSIKDALSKKYNVTAANDNTSPNGYEAADMVEETGTDIAVREMPELGENLQNYCKNLNDKAQSGAVDRLIGREGEVERAIQVFCRRSKNNPILVGDPGVGKTAIAEGLAYKIVNGEVPEVMKNDVILELDMGALIAGTRYRGDFEERLKGVVSEIKAFENEAKKNVGEGERAPRIRLFIDEIHTVIGAGATGGGAMDASNMIKPALASGELSCLGATTYKEYRQHFEKDAALTRRFQKIDVNEPSVEQAKEILRGIKGYFEDHHDVEFTDAAIDAAVDLAKRYIGDRQLPDSAIDIIDEAGAAKRIKGSDEFIDEVEVTDIEDVVSKLARIPARTVSGDDTVRLANLEMDLKNVVFGQDDAIEALTSAVKLARAGLREPEKPIGNYLFTGPTGVGKTEVSKQLADTLGVELLRFDMSEYMEKHSVSRLIGAPPGYVGFDQGGLLTDAVDKSPHCVLLLDEIEKAHPDLFSILLQVMDHGKLTDHNGKQVDFRNVILIMTSNAGAAEQVKHAMGFGRDKREGEDTAAVERAFTPEFRNRLDSVVSFGSLPKEVTQKIVGKFIKQLEDQLADRGVEIDLSDTARAWLAEEGYDDRMGARPLGRVIQEHVKKPLAEQLLFGDLKDGGKVTIVFNEKSKNDSSEPKLSFTFEKKAEDGVNDNDRESAEELEAIRGPEKKSLSPK